MDGKVKFYISEYTGWPISQLALAVCRRSICLLYTSVAHEYALKTKKDYGLFI